MKNPEELAYAMYCADWRDTSVQPPDPKQPLSWEELTEEQQTNYLRYVYTAFNYFFEHGRISAYISHAWLDQYKREYAAYLEAKDKE